MTARCAWEESQVVQGKAYTVHLAVVYIPQFSAYICFTVLVLILNIDNMTPLHAISKCGGLLYCYSTHLIFPCGILCETLGACNFLIVNHLAAFLV